MTTYELYINNTLCDLNADEAISLRYQSPIFSELDSIQSNRSYNISLPLTPRNLQAVEHSQRVDVITNVPYIRLSAALYMNGVPLFTKGYAVITDISDTINVTLTWGNVDNFQPLFDNSLRDLGPQLEELGADRIDWNENSTILDANTGNEYPGVAYWGVNFGMGLGNPKYVHPSVQAMTILEAIEKQHGITIDGKERLAYSPNLGPIVPLVGKNGDDVSNLAEAFIGTVYYQTDFGIILVQSVTQDPRKISSGGNNIIEFEGNDIKTLFMDISGEDGLNRFYVRIDNPIDTTIHFLVLTTSPQDTEVTLLNIESDPVVKEGNYGYYYFDNQHIEVDTDNYKNGIYFQLGFTPSQTYTRPSFFLVVRAWSDWDDIVFPTSFPVAPNLPDMSQGDFILALMNMNGLFAYADKDHPDMIHLISIDDINAKAKAGGIIDWSRKVILNDFNRVDMPDASEFTIDNLAQSNILDYDNDEDVKTETYGIIKVKNENIEKETELVTLPFSASDNAATDGITCAIVPIYEQQNNGDVDYSECSPRILSGRGAIINGLVKCIGIFDPWMKFGGDDGIVESKYNSYRKVVSQVRLISVRVKLSALDLYNLDYTRPVYISQFGQLFAVYSVETGDNDICQCELLKLPFVKYYIYLNGSDADYEEQVNYQSHKLSIPIYSNGTVRISDISNPSLMPTVEISEDGRYVLISIMNNRGGQRSGSVKLVMDEDPDVIRFINITQLSQSPTIG